MRTKIDEHGRQVLDDTPATGTESEQQAPADHSQLPSESSSEGTLAPPKRVYTLVGFCFLNLLKKVKQPLPTRSSFDNGKRMSTKYTIFVKSCTTARG
jgi:hypothetical protein